LSRSRLLLDLKSPQGGRYEIRIEQSQTGRRGSGEQAGAVFLFEGSGSLLDFSRWLALLAKRIDDVPSAKRAAWQRALAALETNAEAELPV
jgi:hypothetical protein